MRSLKWVFNAPLCCFLPTSLFFIFCLFLPFFFPSFFFPSFFFLSFFCFSFPFFSLYPLPVKFSKISLKKLDDRLKRQIFYNFNNYFDCMTTSIPNQRVFHLFNVCIDQIILNSVCCIQPHQFAIYAI